MFNGESASGGDKRGKITRVVEHLRVEAIDERIKQRSQAWRMRRWQVIRCALVHPKPAAFKKTSPQKSMPASKHETGRIDAH